MLVGVLLSAVICMLFYLIYRKCRYEQRFGHIPGPTGIPIFGNSFQLELSKLPMILAHWGCHYGPLYKIGAIGTYSLVVNGYEAIHECLVKLGTHTGGRPQNFRKRHHFKDSGLSRSVPDSSWRLVRKTFHRCIRHFDASTLLEDAVASHSKDMFAKFSNAAQKEEELDPHEVVVDTALRVILVFICGENIAVDDPVFLSCKEYGTLVWKIFDSTSFDAKLLDTFPWLMSVPLGICKSLARANVLQAHIARDLKRRAMIRGSNETLIEYLNQSIARDDRPVLTENDVLEAITTTVFSGFGTSSLSFTFLLNILAHD